MLGAIMSSSFDTLHAIEDLPVLDIMAFYVDNDPTSLSGLDDISGYRVVQSNVRYIYADGPEVGQHDDDTTRSNMVIFLKKADINVVLSHKLIFRIDGRLYKIIDKDYNEIFGLVEFGLSRSD